MKQMIRWKGFIAFVLIIALLAGSTYFFADALVKSLIENQGSKAAGAKVEVAAVDLSLFPAGVVIHQLAVADKDNPMQNLFSVKTISAQFDLLKAFMGQLIIYDTSVEGIALATARSSSGALEKQPVVKEEKKEPSLVSQQLDALTQKLPTAEELLAREPLLTDQREDALQASYAEKKAYLDQAKQNLPDQQALQAYQARFKAISDRKIKTLDDFNQAKQDLDQLKNDIQNDKRTIEDTKAYLQDAQKQLREQLEALKNAPQEDKQRLLGKYSLDSEGALNMSGLLFGSDIQDYLQTALFWYNKIAPYLESDKSEQAKAPRATGEFIRFKEQQPLPSFLIEHMAASASLPMGDIAATAKDITQQPDVINRPASLHIQSSKLKNIQQLDVQAVFDYRLNRGYSTADFALDKVAFKQFKLSGSSAFPLSLETAEGQFKGQIKLQGKALSGQLHGDFSAAQFALGDNLSGTAAVLAQALASIQQFDLDISVSGSLLKPSIHIQSNIDQQLKQAVKNQMDDKIAALKQSLNDKLSARLNGYLAQYDIDGLGDEKSLDAQLKSLDDIAQAKLDDFKDQQKKAAEDKAKDLLKEKLKNLF